MRCSRSASGVRSAIYREPSTGSMHSAAAGADPGQRRRRRRLADGGRLLDAQHLARQRFGSAASAGLPASPVSTTSVVGLVKINAPVLPVAPLGIPVRMSFGNVTVGDADHPVVGGRADVGVHQPVLRVGGRQHDIHQAAVAGRVDRDDRLDLRLGADRDLLDGAGGALGDQRGFAVGAHDQAAGALQAALHHPGSGARLGERRGRQRRRRGRRRAGLRLEFRVGGERLRLGVVEPRAAARHQHQRAQRSEPAPNRPPVAQSHDRQATDIAGTPPQTPVAVDRGRLRRRCARTRLGPTSGHWAWRGKCRLPAKAPLKSPIPGRMPLP